jgi:hypothetical protein
MGMSLRLYLELKKTFPDSFFELNNAIKRDVSFRTLGDKYVQIEKDHTFYEQKVLRVLDSTYLLLIKDGHYELASLCGNELFETGKIAIQMGDQPVISAVIIHFNTMLRYGINQGLKAKEIRNIYNAIFHYSQMIHFFIARNEQTRIIQCCQYFSFYAKEVGKLSNMEPLFVFLIKEITWELQRILISLHTAEFPRTVQKTIVLLFTKLRFLERKKHPHSVPSHYSGVRLVQLALCLHYFREGEEEFNNLILDAIFADLIGLSVLQRKELITHDCELMEGESEDFWEETDQGNRNIFYTPNKDQIPDFSLYAFAKLDRDYANAKLVTV